MRFKAPSFISKLFNSSDDKKNPIIEETIDYRGQQIKNNKLKCDECGNIVGSWAIDHTDRILCLECHNKTHGGNNA